MQPPQTGPGDKAICHSGDRGVNGNQVFSTGELRQNRLLPEKGRGPPAAAAFLGKKELVFNLIL
jgi:hypothetical protein